LCESCEFKVLSGLVQRGDEWKGGTEMKYNEMAIRLVQDLTDRDRSVEKGLPIKWSVMWLDDVRQGGWKDTNMYISGEVEIGSKSVYWSIY